ncbi:MAG: glycosyltransferase family 4 protein [Candidatus Dormibacteraeota bacterium]|nr:glycosyltransferase family 4 protein [Candidatus Dormibacteraeota bacterium]
MVVPYRYGADWHTAPLEPGFCSWRAQLWNRDSIPFHLWDPGPIARALREFRPDVVDIHEEPYWPSGGELAWVARRHPVVMYTAQNIVKHLPLPIAMMQRAVLRRARACYPCSHGAAGVLRRRGFRGPINVVPLGVDDELFTVQRRGQRVGFVGRFVPEKGVDELLHFGAQLLAVGDGPLAPVVRRAGGEVRRARTINDLAHALSEMAVLVAPSRTTATWKEQFGRMVIEAMAAGVPVVASDSGSLPEVVGDAGVIVAEGDSKALRDAVERVSAEPGDLGERGRTRARTLYTWDAVAERMEHVYRMAIAA